MKIVKISDDQNEITLDDGRVLVAEDWNTCDVCAFYDHEEQDCIECKPPCTVKNRKDGCNKVFVERKEESVTIAKSEYDRLLKTRLDAVYFSGAFEVAEKACEKDHMLRIATEFARKIEV